MISEKMAELLNEQLNVEFQAWYKYTAMSAYCSARSLNGFAHWFSMQAEEERMHAMKFYTYLLHQDREVKLKSLAEPPNQFSDLTEVFTAALDGERFVTSCINKLSAAALQEGDHATHVFLQWFITEQVEEEAIVRDILDQLKLLGGSGEGIFLLDREMGQRQPEAGEG